jgi:hypothetical protein
MPPREKLHPIQQLPPECGEHRRQRFFRLGANAKIGVSLGEDYASSGSDYIGCW